MYRVSGIDLRIAQGRKFPGDLRLDARTGGEWRAVDMALALFLVDFFTENEHHRRQYMGHWRQNGDMYFVRRCVDAVRRGWRAVAADIARQREERAS